MDIMTFELTKTFKYANGSGAEIECSHIDLHAPTGKISHLCCSVEGMIQTAVLTAADTLLSDDDREAAKEAAQGATAKNDPSEQKDGEAILALLNSSGVDMNKLIIHFREIFKSVAWMGGEKLITQARLDEMSHKDLRRMVGVYTANFILS